MRKEDADWGGKLQKRFRWSKLRFEYGRYYYQTDCTGATLGTIWVWEDDQ